MESEKLKAVLIMALSLIYSCGQDFNSSSFDELLYDSVSIGDTPFGRSYVILQEKCINCHNNNYHGSWGAYITSDQWVSASLVVPGDFEGSIIISRLNNYGGDMPQGGGNLTETEIATLREWIEGL